jgi:hypothetical protein
MRTYLALAAVLGVTACGGGGGGGAAVPGGQVGSAPTPSPSSSPGTQSKYATPTFSITIPMRGGSKLRGKTPAFISTAVQSISITLKDVNGTSPGPIAGNPAVSNISSATCGSGCTVNGPPSPLGNDTFTLTTYDGTSGSGNELDTSTGTYTLSQGANSETITLDGIPATISVRNVPSTWTANSTFSAQIGGAGSSGIEVSAYDADAEILIGTYANPITFQDPDTGVLGTWVTPGAAGCSPSPGSATSITLTSDAAFQGTFCYAGIAEQPVVFSVAAAGVSTIHPQFQTNLNAPTYISASATGIADDATQQINLYNSSGTGSVGSLAYQELGWTNAPYNQQLVAIGTSGCTAGALSTYANFSTAPFATPAGTAFTATAIGSPSTGACTVQIGDNLQLNTTVSGATFAVTYTASDFNVSNHGRKH